MGKVRRIERINRITTRVIAPAALLAIVAFAGILWSSGASAASYVAQYVGAAVNGTWVKVNTSGPVNIDIVPTATGTLGINKSEVSVETNANTGYRLYLSGINSESNGYTALYRNGNPSDTSKFTSITAESTSPTSLTNGQWGWALPASAAGIFPAASAYENLAAAGSTTDSSTINNLKFAGIKQNYTFIKSTNTSNENNPDNLDIYYGALADNSMTIGSYYNVIVYTAFVEGSDTISVSPSQVADGDTMTVATNIQGNANPITPEQVEIALYDPSDETKNIGTCDNISIPSEHNGTVGKALEISCTFHANANTVRNVSYGVRLKIDPKNNGVYLSYDAGNAWKYGKPLDQLTYMQDVTASDCAVTPNWDDSNITYTLADNRETPNKSYLIRKLADGNCWMVQNLALQGNTTISWENSDLPKNTTYTLPDGETTNGKFSDGTADDVFDGSHTNASPTNSSDNTGAYYSFMTAIAKNTTSTRVSDISDDSINLHYDSSICPRGWKLPTARGESIGIYSLVLAYERDKTRFDSAWALGNVRAGHIANGRLTGGYNIGRWWTSDTHNVSPTDCALAIFDNTDESSVYTGSWGGGKSQFGFSIRCVAADE